MRYKLSMRIACDTASEGLWRTGDDTSLFRPPSVVGFDISAALIGLLRPICTDRSAYYVGINVGVGWRRTRRLRPVGASLGIWTLRARSPITVGVAAGPFDTWNCLAAHFERPAPNSQRLRSKRVRTRAETITVSRVTYVISTNGN